MTEKYAKEEKIEAEAEVHLYLMILEMLEKHKEAWELVSGPLGGEFWGPWEVVYLNSYI